MLSDELLQQLTTGGSKGCRINRTAMLAAAKAFGVLERDGTFSGRSDAWNRTIALLDFYHPGWRGYEVQHTYRRVA